MLTISDDILKASGFSEMQLRHEIAVYLYSKNKLSFGQAKTLSGLDVLQFQELLYNNNIPSHYNVAELEADYKAIKSKAKE